MSLVQADKKGRLHKRISVFDLLSKTSTIHGVSYISDYRSPRSTRTFWICAFTLSILGCVYYSTQIYDKWYVTPDIGLKIKYKSARNIPFPAITICPQTKIKREFLNYNEAFQTVSNESNPNATLSENDKKYLELALQTCTPLNSQYTNEIFRESAALAGKDLVTEMSNVEFTVNETVVGCIPYEMDDCSNIFTRVPTTDGFCISFNLEDHKNLFNDDSDLSSDFDYYKNGKESHYDVHSGYDEKNQSLYPTRIFSGGKNAVIFIMAHNKHDIDEGCLGPDQGFKIFWHMPNEIPGYWHHSILVNSGKARHLHMKATRVTTTTDLLRYDLKQRRCFYKNERKLQYFKSYTKSHCDLECLSNYMLQKCDCVRFWMPRNSSTPVCDITNLLCAEKAEKSWLEDDKNYQEDNMPCDCYPSCARLTYDVTMNTEVHFDTNETLIAFNEVDEFYKDFKSGVMSRLIIQFEDFWIEDQENYLGYKMQHFISDCGGLLGLFMGCSILSLVELLYQIFASFFPSANAEIEDSSKRNPTPKRDNKAVVLHCDDDDIKNE